MRGEFWYWGCNDLRSESVAEKNADQEDFPRERRLKSECAALTSSLDRNNSDGKASFKRQKSPETTTDTQDASKFYWFYV